LDVATVRTVIAPAVAKVNSADESDVGSPVTRAPNDEELLVMGPSGPHPHIEQTATAGLLDVLTQVAILGRTERELVQMRAPDQTVDHHPSGSSCAQRSGYRRAAVGEHLIRITAPVGEEEHVTVGQACYTPEQGVEVRKPVHQRRHKVAFRPGVTSAMAAVEAGVGVAALSGRQEPVVVLHGCATSALVTPCASAPRTTRTARR
jgi:hypothetical protein